MNNYWERRELKQREAIFNASYGSAQKELSKQYIRCLEATKRQMVDLYDEIQKATADGTLLVSDLYKYNRYYELMNSLNKELRVLGNSEVKITEKNLLDMYNITSKAVGSDLSFAIMDNPQAAQAVLDAVWCADGKHWSSRIWSNKADLQERLQNGLIDCVSRGASKDELVKRLMKDMNVGYNQANRIARTELTYVQNKATLDKYAQAGIDKYQYLATSDDRTDDRCSNLDGKIFLLSQAHTGENFPPMHANCRCTILAVL